MTREYYTDSYTLNFTAEVVAVETVDGRPAVLLDRSWFYPASGGQPHDTGRLIQGSTTALVVDVIDDEDGDDTLHVLDRPLTLGPVTAEIDRARRLDHMQHHTGQHILSEAFVQVAEAETVGFHLSPQSVTIDVNRADLTAEAIDAAETLANEIVRQDRPVSVRFVTVAEAAELPLRKRPPGKDGLLRLIDIEAFDLNACGGTHVARTGEVGLIKVAGTERRGATTRVEFLCGGRALADYRQKQAVVRELGAALTTGPTELLPSVLKLQEENKELRHILKQREATLLAFEAERLLATAEPLGDEARLVARVFTDRAPDELRRLATLIAEAGQTVALLGIAGERSHLIFCRSAGAPGEMNALIKPALAALGGRGGGNATMAQGGGPPADEQAVAEVLAAAATQLRTGS